MNANKISLEEQEKFFEFINNHDFISNDGQLDLYAFAFFLHRSLWLDELNPPAPHELGDLLMEVIDEKMPDGHKTIRDMVLIDAHEVDRAIYPTGKSIAIHISAIVCCIQTYIYYLGYFLGFEATDDDKYYAFWLRKKHVYSWSILNRLLTQIRQTVREISCQNEAIGGQMQTLYLRQSKDVNELYQNLLKKNDLLKHALSRISLAMENGFFIEAIALQESVIADRLSMYLYLNGQEPKYKGLSKLIVELSQSPMTDKKIMEDLDDWRKKRNKAIHGLVRSSPYDQQDEPEEFASEAMLAAKQGARLLERVNCWFDDLVYEHLSVFSLQVRE